MLKLRSRNSLALVAWGALAFVGVVLVMLTSRTSDMIVSTHEEKAVVEKGWWKQKYINILIIMK